MITVTIIRSGERLDRAHPGVWEDYCKRHFRHNVTKLASRIQDPPLTEKGVEHARHTADSLLKQLQSSEYIFSSNLTRTVQTAYELAAVSGKSIVVSKSFANNSLDTKHDSRFECMSIEDLRFLCPGVVLIDGDVKPEMGGVSVPSGTCKEGIEYVAEQYPNSIIVSHQQVIRHLSGDQYLSVPCCGSCTFELDRGAGSCRLAKLRDCEGCDIENIENEPRSKRRCGGFMAPAS